MLHYSAVPPGALDTLNKIRSIKAFDDFVLVGGTALALYWGHRLSIDLDLFNNKDFDQDYLLEELEKATFNFGFKSPTKIGLFVNINQTKVDFVNIPYNWIRPVKVIDNIKIADLDDIAAMKISAVTGRGVKKDFYDLYYLLKHYTMQELLNLYSEKFANRDIGFVVRSIVYFEDAEHNEAPVVTDKSVTWEEVKNFITQQVRDFM